MSYVALYNKYRPQVFSDVVGQEKVVEILKKSIIRDKIANGYLFVGNRGLGKTTLAKIFSKALNCTDVKDGEPCNDCDMCNSINSDRAFDVIELDAASNRGVDTIRDVIINKVNLKPRSKYKVYIVDECHMFTNEAWNALLKTLEQPPKYCVFIFCTTAYDKVPKTIVSRVQTFLLRDMNNDDIVNRLKYICKREDISSSKASLYAIARYAKGGMRDSISALDQISSFGQKITTSLVASILGIAGDDVAFKLFDAILSKDYSACVNVLNDASNENVNIIDLFDVICSYTRNYIKLANNCDIRNSDISNSAIEFLKSHVVKNEFDYHCFIKLIIDNERSFRYSKDKQLVFLTLISKYIVTNDNSDILKRLALLENKSSTVSSGTDLDLANNTKASIKSKLKMASSKLSDDSDEDDDEVDVNPADIENSFNKWLANGRKRGNKNAKK